MKGKAVLGVALAGGVFAGGMVAPDSWRTAVQNSLVSVSGEKTPDAKTKPKTASKPVTAKKSKKDAPAPLPMASITRPLALSDGDVLGLGIGFFTTEEASALRNQQAKALGYVTQTVALKNKQNAIWYLLIAGKYDNNAQVERARPILEKSLNLGFQADIVLIPPTKK